MPLALLRRAVDELGPWLYEVWLYNWGEPLLNPELFKMIAYCSERNIRTVVSSNLNLFKPAMAPGLVDSGLDTLIASIDGATQETYERYRRKGDFAKALAGLRAVAVERARQGLKRPRLVWQFIVFGHNEHEMMKAAGMAESAGADEIRFISSFAKMGGLTESSTAQKLKELAGYLPGDSRFQLYAPEAGQRPARPARCTYLWAQMSLRADGGAAPCCGSYLRGDDFGSVTEGGLLGVWNNAKYRRARRAVRSSGWQQSGTICDDCLRNCP
jgi:MoaA/NifB/PqqE/SkfB family radical SAM enzyme